MFNEKDLMPQTSELPKDRLSQEEIQLQIKWDLDKAVAEYINKNLAEATSDDYFEAFHKIETLQNMAKKFANEDLDKYIEKKLVEIKNHKDLSSQTKLKNMGPLKRIPRPGIGTHR